MKKITILDDDPDLRSLLKVVLQFAEAEVEVFSSGEEFFANHKGPTDLFIVDINLGGMSGVEVCQKLKLQPETKNVPVIIISAHPELETLSKQICANEMLQKPFSHKVLIDKIKKLLAL